MPDGHDPYAALRSPDYRRVLTANVLGGTGFGMQFLAVEWELYQRTDSAAALGLIGLIQFLPVLILAIPAGHPSGPLRPQWLYVTPPAIITTASLCLATVS